MRDDETRLGTILGFFAGGGAGLLISFVLYHSVAELPVQPVVFLLLVVGAFAGMAVSDRLGTRAVRVMGIASGVVLALGLTLFLVLSSA